MATLGAQVSPPEPFSFNKPEQWCRWIRRFERYVVASGLADKGEEAKLNTLIYCMGDEADDILRSFTYADGVRVTVQQRNNSLMKAGVCCLLCA